MLPHLPPLVLPQAGRATQSPSPLPPKREISAGGPPASFSHIGTSGRGAQLKILPLPRICALLAGMAPQSGMSEAAVCASEEQVAGNSAAGATIASYGRSSLYFSHRHGRSPGATFCCLSHVDDAPEAPRSLQRIESTTSSILSFTGLVLSIPHASTPRRRWMGRDRTREQRLDEEKMD